MNAENLAREAIRHFICRSNSREARASVCMQRGRRGRSHSYFPSGESRKYRSVTGRNGMSGNDGRARASRRSGERMGSDEEKDIAESELGTRDGRNEERQYERRERYINGTVEITESGGFGRTTVKRRSFCRGGQLRCPNDIAQLQSNRRSIEKHCRRVEFQGASLNSGSVWVSKLRRACRRHPEQ